MSGRRPVITGGAQRATLTQFLDAVERGVPVAVPDPTWPPPVRDAAIRLLEAATLDGRLGDGEFVVFSSGSTGTARAIRRTLTSWRASADVLGRLIALQPGDVVGVPGPLSSSLYLHAAWHAVASGCEVVLADEWAGGRDRVNVLHAVPGLLQGWQQVPAGLRVAVLGGDHVTTETRDRLRGNGVRLVEYYGSGEASFVLMGAGDHLVPFPGVSVRVDADGVLWSRSALAFAGYLDGGPATLDDGWLSVGDRAELTAGGFRLLGRPGTVASGGHTVLGAEVESALMASDLVRGAVVTGLPDARLGQVVTAVVELAAGVQVTDVRRAVLSLPAPARPRRWVAVDALPRLSSGKPDRNACEALAQARR